MDVLAPKSIRPRDASINQFKELRDIVQSEGLFNRTISYYVKIFIGTTLVGLTAWTLSLIFANSWWVLAFAILIGICTAQYGFISHEGSHRQVFSSNKLNDWMGLIIADGFVGLGYGWWVHKHNKHHVTPNKIGNDPDIDINVLSFTPEALAKKKGIEKFLSKNQGKLFYVFLPFTGFDLLFESYKALLNKNKRFKHRYLELFLLTLRISTPIVLAFTFMTPLLAACFVLLQMMTLGVFLGGAFAPNHKGMPLIAKGAKIDFLRRQVLTSRNIKPHFLTDFFMGGLNYQIEHHLFPSMPRPHLKRAQQITEEFCNKNGIKYIEVNLIEAYRSVVKYLDDVGMSRKTADPFTCPMAAYRYIS